MIKMNYPNTFLDDETEKDIKQHCRKCYKLDRIKNRCDKYGKDLVVDSPGKLDVFYKCGECLNKKT